MGVSKAERERFREGVKAYSPMQAAILYCKTGYFPEWLDRKPMEYLREFWQMERLSRKVV